MNTLGVIAMDLKRAALGSEKTARVFLVEAAKKKKMLQGIYLCISGKF